jgi:hypothetical protein
LEEVLVKYLKFIFAFISICGIFKIFVLGSSHEVFSYTLLPKTTTILIGDSHAQYGFNDKVIPGSINLGYRSEKFIWSYRKLQKILESNPQIENIVLSVSYHSFTKGNEVEIIGSERSFFYNRYGRLFNKIDYSVLLKETLNNKELILNYLKYEFGLPVEGYKELRQLLMFGLFGRKIRPEFWGYYHQDFSNQLSKSKLSKVIERHYLESGRSRIQELYFHKIVQLTLEYGVKLTLVTLPVHTKYLKRVPLERIQHLHMLTNWYRNYGVDYLNYSTLKIGDSFFKDHDHLNDKGAMFLAGKYLRSVL